MLFLCSGPHNTSFSNAVKKVAVLKYHPQDVFACDENEHVLSPFQAMRSDGSTMLSLFFLIQLLCAEMNSLAHFGG